MTSVRGTRTVFREREDDVEVSEAPQRRTYTTVKRYQVPESITRSVASADEDVTEKKIVVRRERHDDDRSSFVERPRREIPYRVVRRGGDDDFLEVREVDRETLRSASPRHRHGDYRVERDFDVEKFTKSTEYYQSPQPIIIREAAAPQPIIIREERREPQRIIIRREEPRYEFIERREVEEVKDKEEEVQESTGTEIVKAESVASTAPQPPPQPEEDYFYERRILQRRRRSSSHDRRTESRPASVRPRDSASQYSSDDSSFEYVRREKVVEERGASPHHKRHLAEGALVGMGAAAIMRNHRKKSTGETNHRGRDYLGGAAVGALGAEALSRVRSMRSLRRSSRSRSASSDYHSRRDGKSVARRRSRSRDGPPRIGALGGLAAVAAVGALAGYALSNKGGNKNETIIVKDGKRRVRRRRASHDSYLSSNARGIAGPNSAQEPGHRNKVMASAGLASAAAAGVWEHFRSRSRGGRSKSRVRQGIPIAAAGLGGAALAGLYEQNKANKEAKKQAIIQDEIGRGRRRRSRSRSTYRADPAPGAGPGYYSDEEPGYYRRRGGSAGSSPDARYSRSRSRRRLPDAATAGAAAYGGYDAGRARSRSRGPAYDDGYGDPYQHAPHAPDQYQQDYSHNSTQPQQSYPGGTYFPPPPQGDYNAGAPNNQRDAYGGAGASQQPADHPAYNPADYAGPQQQQQYGSGPYHDQNAPYAGEQRYSGANHGERGGPGGRDPENMV